MEEDMNIIDLLLLTKEHNIITELRKEDMIFHYTRAKFAKMILEKQQLKFSKPYLSKNNRDIKESHHILPSMALFGEFNPNDKYKSFSDLVIENCKLLNILSFCANNHWVRCDYSANGLWESISPTGLLFNFNKF